MKTCVQRSLQNLQNCANCANWHDQCHRSCLRVTHVFSPKILGCIKVLTNIMSDSPQTFFCKRPSYCLVVKLQKFREPLIPKQMHQYCFKVHCSSSIVKCMSMSIKGRIRELVLARLNARLEGQRGIDRTSLSEESPERTIPYKLTVLHHHHHHKDPEQLVFQVSYPFAAHVSHGLQVGVQLLKQIGGSPVSEFKPNLKFRKLAVL